MKKESGKKISMEDLAGMVARGFAGMDTKFAKVNSQFEKIEKEFEKVEDNFKKIRTDILDIGDKFVPRHEFDTLLIRVSRLEQRVKEKVG
ncbi:MAG: hypothetical protein COV91_04905 [Candidatus Taylorbacteria bacterium CG11_big_fil_rev_8_21_14_0_20_46_11]|uniref:Uncharacterized protein n=1 Tax=Candidatus Taylorbacteria bacterium CG11_big_fil_rev_8_21_14_0_20_46_11 TaxID=1975025 RepID=A0A2H0KAJ7_9BACT|nr:MAG: hypothetical protein COV91_04905 [Candidatus Taylorbacteria bacterium CG11_big_fil_rev_8_21_14_0_20_46_11]